MGALLPNPRWGNFVLPDPRKKRASGGKTKPSLPAKAPSSSVVPEVDAKGKNFFLTSTLLATDTSNCSLKKVTKKKIPIPKPLFSF
jgi:hypothetical protein